MSVRRCPDGADCPDADAHGAQRMTIREEILGAVLAQLEDAEGIGGPEGDEYVALFEDIIAEAQRRLAAFRATQRGRVVEEIARIADAFKVDVWDVVYATGVAPVLVDPLEGLTDEQMAKVLSRMSAIENEITKGDAP